MVMKLDCLGSSQEVGRSGFVLDTGSEKMLLDYGLLVVNGLEGGGQPKFPKDAPTDLDGVILSHAHLDHTGYAPSLYARGYEGPVYGTATTFDLMEILHNDSLKLARFGNYSVGYKKKDVRKLQENLFRIAYGQHFDIGATGVSLHDAGHLPGSSQVLMETPEKNVLYSGDIKMESTELLDGLTPVDEDVDVLITEATYGTKEHPNRERTEERLVEKIRQTTANGGIAMVASFATGRAQELLLVMEKFGIDVPVYMDGMAVAVTEVVLRYSEFLRYPKMLKRAYNRAKPVKSHGMRKRIIKKDEPCVIITTSGMLNGGPIAYYLEQLKDRRDCYLALTGYQAEDSSGRHLLNTGEYRNEEKSFKVKVPYDKFDFSAHAGRHEILDYIKQVDPEKIICVHSDESEKFAAELRDEHGYDATGPAIGETVNL